MQLAVAAVATERAVDREILVQNISCFFVQLQFRSTDHQHTVTCTCTFVTNVNFFFMVEDIYDFFFFFPQSTYGTSECVHCTNGHP